MSSCTSSSPSMAPLAGVYLNFPKLPQDLNISSTGVFRLTDSANEIVSTVADISSELINPSRIFLGASGHAAQVSYQLGIITEHLALQVPYAHTAYVTYSWQCVQSMENPLTWFPSLSGLSQMPPVLIPNGQSYECGPRLRQTSIRLH